MTTAQTPVWDRTLIAQAQGGDDAALSQLILQLMPMVRRQAARYRLPGMEGEDLVQEGLLGLLKALRLYDPAQSQFFTFASLCVASQMASAARLALSCKSRPLRDYAPLDGQHSTLETAASPEEHAILSEQMKELEINIATLLSGFEQQTLRLYLSGLSYQQIATLQHTSAKAVDNALQRVRRKLRSA